MKIDKALELLSLESTELFEFIVDATDSEWTTDTPAVGWSVADHIAHLHWLDLHALLALRKPEEFTTVNDALKSNPDLSDQEAHRISSEVAQADLIREWHEIRQELIEEIRALDPAEPVEWVVSPMRPSTLASAITMETWAHNLDIHDALLTSKPRSRALEAVAELGVKTRDYSFKMHNLEPPTEDIFVKLTMPVGPAIIFGDSEASQSVIGSAFGFCAAVTKRRNLADADINTRGDDATQWMKIAQSFGGAPVQGPALGERLVIMDLED